jgi:hypothetical protein
LKLPDDVSIAREKISHYLLVWQSEDDKSAFLAKGGYSPFNPDSLLQALTKLGKEGEARWSGWNRFGFFCEVRGVLSGIAGGKRLEVRTIWMTDHLSGNTKFVTLIPVRILK